MTDPVLSGDAAGAIAAPPPAFDGERAVEIARERYGLDVTATPLVSERDQNFRLRAADGSQYVLKIANASEDVIVSRFQIDALQHIATQGEAGVSVPAILPTLDGESHFLLADDGRQHVTRVVSYLAGTPLADVPLTASLARSLGACLASLDRALGSFSHAGEEQPLLWDLKRAPELRGILKHVADREIRALLTDTLTGFERHALPAFAELRWQVIHNDANPGNVLVAADDDERVAGVIDFGDMLRSPLIVELGVAGAYLRVADGNPLALIVELLAGYHAVTPLTRAEVDVLHDLIKTRLATTVAILAWRASMRDADDDYLRDAEASEATALPFLSRLAEIPRENARQIYSQVCASISSTR